METTPSTRARINLSLDYRLVCILLLIIMGVMVWLWKPWHHTANSGRTISVTGDATLTAEPDEFTFTPSYDFTNSDAQAALSALTAKSNDIITQLKALGVPSNKIQTNSNNWSYPNYYDPANGSTPTYTLQLTIIVNSQAVAQKVQDYLLTTSPSGQISPQADFSDSKRKALENQARDQATTAARAKAQQSAKNLGFKLGSVKSIDDSNGFGSAYPLETGSNLASGAADSKTSLSIQPGENDLSYSITVTYYIN